MCGIGLFVGMCSIGNDHVSRLLYVVLRMGKVLYLPTLPNFYQSCHIMACFCEFDIMFYKKEVLTNERFKDCSKMEWHKMPYAWRILSHSYFIQGSF